MDPSAYREHAGVEAAHWWFSARRTIVETVARALLLPPGARVVELGAGTGGNLEMLSGLGEVVAIEPDDAARAISRERSPQVRHIARIEDMTGGSAFDAAFALDVLEHIDDAPAALRKLAAWMAPRAPLVVTVPAHGWLFGEHDVFLHHVRRYSSRALREHLTAGGFDVDFVRPMFAPLLPVAAVLRGIEALASRTRARPARSRGMTMPPHPVNTLLRAMFSLERHAGRRGVPFGLSLLAVARKSDR